MAVRSREVADRLPAGEVSDELSFFHQRNFHRFHAVVINVIFAEQRLLGLPRSVGALAIDRLGYAGDRPVEWRRTLIRGDRFSLIAEFSQRTGYQLHLDSRYADLRPAS